MRNLPFAFLMIVVSAMMPNIVGADHLGLKISGESVELDGEILIEAKDGSLYFQEIDGRIWFVKPEQILTKIKSDSPADPISKKAFGERLLKELPAGFRIHETKHYVIAYQNEVAYARWVGGLYESRLYRAFETFWKRKKLDLTEPDFPLVAIVFGSRTAYQQYVDRELGPGQTMIAYYNLESNRIAMFDLTAEQRNPNARLDNRRIDEILQNPAAIGMVATMIHEATHQLMFNRGVQTRFAESPLWLNEGIAMYFEAPNLNSRRGWQAPGLVFERRLVRFHRYAATRPVDSLRELIRSDERLRDSDTALDAYAEAWALNHFLFKRHAKEYSAYLQFMATKKPLVEDSSDVRLAEFERFFGDEWDELNREFLVYVRRLR